MAAAAGTKEVTDEKTNSMWVVSKPPAVGSGVKTSFEKRSIPYPSQPLKENEVRHKRCCSCVQLRTSAAICTQLCCTCRFYSTSNMRLWMHRTVSGSQPISKRLPKRKVVTQGSTNVGNGADDSHLYFLTPTSSTRRSRVLCVTCSRKRKSNAHLRGSYICCRVEQQRL